MPMKLFQVTIIVRNKVVEPGHEPYRIEVMKISAADGEKARVKALAGVKDGNPVWINVIGADLESRLERLEDARNREIMHQFRREFGNL